MLAPDAFFMTYPEPPHPEPPRPQPQQQLPSMQPIPPAPPMATGSAPARNAKTKNIRSLNRATAVAVSMAMVGVVGLGTGIAVASVGADSSQISESPQLRDPNLGSGPGAPADPYQDDDDDDFDDGAGALGGGTERQVPDPGSDLSGGFRMGPPNGGSHGMSGAS